MNLFPDRILDEIERQKTNFPHLAYVNQVWIVETMAFEAGSHLGFERYEKGVLVESFHLGPGEIVE
jgi:hypothetical protein